MLQVFHKYQKSVLVILLAIVVCAAMLLFGLNPYGPSQSEAFALKINGQEISQYDFNQARSNLESNYRRQLGNFYDQLAEQGSINVTQQTLDSMIPETLLRQFAVRQEIYSSSSNVREALLNLFGENFSQENYQQFLRSRRMKAEQFENQLASQILPSVLAEIIKDHSNVTTTEVKSHIRKKESEFTYYSANFDPKKLEAEVTEPEAEVLKNYYEQEATSYEEPEKIKYNYIVLDPNQNLDLVEVLEEDIELYYADNLENFKIEDQVKLRIIELDSENQEAQTLVDEINGGKDFAEYAKKHSLDAESKDKGGELGWLTREQISEAMAEFVFDNPQMGVAKLIFEEENQSIVKIEDFQEAGMKELEEVADEIKATIQKQDAPSYTLIKGQDLYDNWLEEKTLEEIAKEENIEVQSTDFLAAGQEARYDLRNLTSEVLALKEEEKQFHEVGNFVVLAEVVEYKENRIPEQAEIKDKLIADYKTVQAKDLASEKAQKLIEEYQSDQNFEDFAKELGAEVEKREDLKPLNKGNELGSPEIHEAVFTAKQTGLVPSSFEYSNKPYVLLVDSITAPSEERINELVEENREELENKNFEQLMQSIVNKLKAEAEIEIAPGLLDG